VSGIGLGDLIGPSTPDGTRDDAIWKSPPAPSSGFFVELRSSIQRSWPKDLLWLAVRISPACSSVWIRTSLLMPFSWRTTIEGHHQIGCPAAPLLNRVFYIPRPLEFELQIGFFFYVCDRQGCGIRAVHVDLDLNCFPREPAGQNKLRRPGVSAPRSNGRVVACRVRIWPSCR